MIRVVVDVEHLNFAMEGHADFGPVGSDIVCAAATMLASTLIQNMTRRLDKSEIPGCVLNSGYALLNVNPIRKRMRNECRIVFAAILQGFELLAQRYPEHVVID